MTTIFILARKVSPYSGADVLLGAFHDRPAAEAASESYLERYRQFPADDPWDLQSYKLRGLLVEDLQIEAFNLENSSPGSEISIVSFYYDGMGQLMREIDSLHESRATADQRVAEVEAAKVALNATRNRVPDYCLVQTLTMGELHSDLPEDQPVF